MCKTSALFLFNVWNIGIFRNCNRFYLSKEKNQWIFIIIVTIYSRLNYKIYRLKVIYCYMSRKNRFIRDPFAKSRYLFSIYFRYDQTWAILWNLSRNLVILLTLKLIRLSNLYRHVKSSFTNIYFQHISAKLYHSRLLRLNRFMRKNLCR